MASTSSAPPDGAVASRIKTATTAIRSENQSLISEIRKSVTLLKEIAVDLERENKSDMVKELEAGVVQLLEASEDCMHFSSAIQCIGNEYQPGDKQTDFKKLFNDQIAKSKGGSSFVLQSHPLLRQFRQAIWTVHHVGQPMPGEEQEDIVMTSTQCNLLNFNCPLSGKPVTELADPVRSMNCKHIYEKAAIMQYIMSKNGHAQCPMAGCPKRLREESVICDPFLHIEIDEARSMEKQSARPEIIEDFTETAEEECLSSPLC